MDLPIGSADKPHLENTPRQAIVKISEFVNTDGAAKYLFLTLKLFQIIRSSNNKTSFSSLIQIKKDSILAITNLQFLDGINKCAG